MAFASAKTKTTVFGDMKVVFGTYTNGSGDTGGDISTGLKRVYGFFLQPTSSSVIASAPVVNESFPLAGGVVTIVTTDNEDGIWTAYGK